VSRYLLGCCFTIIGLGTVVAQTSFPAEDSAAIRTIYDLELVNGQVFTRLTQLCNTIGPRLSGSKNASAAVDWAQKLFNTAGLTHITRQRVTVPHWERGGSEVASFKTMGHESSLNICALGGSIATPDGGLNANVLEVKDFDQLRALGKKVQGKIIFFDRPFDGRYFDTGKAYGHAVDQRVNGAAEAAKLGALGVIVRSMTELIDDYPHTGMMRYIEGVRQIPACAVSTAGAQALSRALLADPGLTLRMTLHCKTLPDVTSYNLLGEIQGSDPHSTIILVGGHLDSWDLAQGAHDDGAGVMQSLEALELLKRCGYSPKHTLRVVFFMNEENGARGAAEYARASSLAGEHYLAAIESDEGGFTPRGFVIASKTESFNKMFPWQELLRPYGSGWFRSSVEAGTDIEPLAPMTVALIGVMPDNQRYFDVHHSSKDRIDTVNERELKLGAASIAALIYLIDKKGL